MTKQVLPLLIPSDHPAYVGHFPGQPILPGVVFLDEAQYALTFRERLQVAFTAIISAKFLNPVKPGEALRLSYATTAAAVYSFEVLAGERVVASGVLTFHMPGVGSGIS